MQVLTESSRYKDAVIAMVDQSLHQHLADAARPQLLHACQPLVPRQLHNMLQGLRVNAVGVTARCCLAADRLLHNGQNPVRGLQESAELLKLYSVQA